MCFRLVYFDWLHVTLHLPVNQVLRFKVRDFLIFFNIFRLSNKNLCVEKKNSGNISHAKKKPHGSLILIGI